MSNTFLRKSKVVIATAYIVLASSLLTTSLASAYPQSASDNSLASVRQSDLAARTSDGKLARLSAAEHMRRANVYMSNRAFAEAREHWESLLKNYPQDVNVPAAMFGMGRSYFQERKYQEAFDIYDRLRKAYPLTKDGREALNFSAAAALRMGRASEAADRYRMYTEQYPGGERIESAYLNVIDALREAGRPKEAAQWVTKTRGKFADTPTDTNAQFAQLRLDVAEGNWKHAIATADALSAQRFQKAVLTTLSEVRYLKAFSLQQLGKKDEAIATYLNIPEGVESYYGWLATQRLQSLVSESQRASVNQREDIKHWRWQFTGPSRGCVIKFPNARFLSPVSSGPFVRAARVYILALRQSHFVIRSCAR
jgi:TolA-binding protein